MDGPLDDPNPSAVLTDRRQDFRDEMSHLQDQLRREERHYLFHDALKGNFTRAVSALDTNTTNMPVPLFRWMTFRDLSNYFWQNSLLSSAPPHPVSDTAPTIETIAFQAVDVDRLTADQLVDFIWFNGNPPFEWEPKEKPVDEPSDLPPGHHISQPIVLASSPSPPPFDKGKDISNPIVLPLRPRSPLLPKPRRLIEQDALAKANAETRGGMSKDERVAVISAAREAMQEIRAVRKKEQRRRGNDPTLQALNDDIEYYDRDSNKGVPLHPLPQLNATLSSACRPGSNTPNQTGWIPTRTHDPPFKGPPEHKAKPTSREVSSQKNVTRDRAISTFTGLQVFDWTSSGWIKRERPMSPDGMLPRSTKAAADTSSELTRRKRRAKYAEKKSQPQSLVISISSDDDEQPATIDTSKDGTLVQTEAVQTWPTWTPSGWVPQRPLASPPRKESTAPVEGPEAVIGDISHLEGPRSMPPPSISTSRRIEQLADTMVEAVVEAATRGLTPSPAKIAEATTTLAPEEAGENVKVDVQGDASCVDADADKGKESQEPDHVSHVPNVVDSDKQQVSEASEAVDHGTVQEEIDSQLATDMNRMAT
ncbi:hypothetical protein F4779DRAFT_638549 [Xylariaceae sp. FL0662B]|nr:hypothetical protein F4779DRAFT_638549 [Xylariaceae sp. FL0662B]